jgi:hypothetical protein
MSTVRATIQAPNDKKPAQQPAQPMVGAGSLVVTMPDGTIREVVTVRTYMSASRNASVVKACVWIRPSDRASDWHTGRGDAGGYGYHKESAAIAEAVRNAGVTLYGTPYHYGGNPVDMDRTCDFGGSGSSGYRDIFTAIARAVGYEGAAEWISHSL